MIKLIRQKSCVGRRKETNSGYAGGNREGGDGGIFIAFHFSRDFSGLWEADDILAGKFGFGVYTKLNNFASFRRC